MRSRDLGLVGLLSLALLTAATPARGEAPPRVPILLDCDLGDDIDDAFALALAVNQPRFDLRGVTTVFGDTRTRATVATRFLHAIGKKVPVAVGLPGPNPVAPAGQLQYGRRPAHGPGPIKQDAVAFLYEQLKAHPGELTVVAVGPLTNIAALLTRHPDCKPWIKRLFIMGGSVRVGYNDKPPINAEWNIKQDIAAARTVFTSGLPLTVAPLDATTSLKLDEPLRRRVFTAHTPLTNQLYALYQLWENTEPVLYDPVALALCLDEQHFTMEQLRLEVDDKGFTRIVEGKPNARVATRVEREPFLRWYVEQIAGKAPMPALPLPITHPSKPVERGQLPERVHVVEDFETDIEKRWWLAGKVETKNVPPGSKRALRGVWTNDFDDRQGDKAAMYTAVIFNPVPGPPMGPRTRLAFRYWLKGTDKLRCQIYSLSNGYHRCLTLTELPQGEWREATVDLTQARQPNGGGGPLSENERIDDIQFYTDPNAELLIDDIVLYEAAPEAEKRPFPNRIHFTGWFDTGRQGAEWPGTFTIVPKEKPLTWKAAKAVARSDGRAWIDLHLRGQRPVGPTARLRFRYHLSAAEPVTVQLKRGADRAAGEELTFTETGKWAEADLAFTLPKDWAAKDRWVNAIEFWLPAKASLLVDDVLLYERDASNTP